MKLPTPMGPPTELDELMAQLFPTEIVDTSSYSPDERKKFWESFGTIKDVAVPILDIAEHLPKAKRQVVIQSLIVMCMAYARAMNVGHEKIHRLMDEISKRQTEAARSTRTSNSELVRKVVRKHALRAWERNPKLQDNARATADKILPGVNAELAQLYPKIGNQKPKIGDQKLDTIRKHVAEIQRELKRRP